MSVIELSNLEYAEYEGVAIQCLMDIEASSFNYNGVYERALAEGDVISPQKSMWPWFSLTEKPHKSVLACSKACMLKLAVTSGVRVA